MCTIYKSKVSKLLRQVFNLLPRIPRGGEYNDHTRRATESLYQIQKTVSWEISPMVSSMCIYRNESKYV